MPLKALSAPAFRVKFNQDSTLVVIATVSGFRVYHCDSQTCCYEDNGGAIGLVELLFCTSLLALVGAGEHAAHSPRRLSLVNASTRARFADLPFPSTILALALNSSRLVVVLECKALVHDLHTLELMDMIATPHNPKGVCALSQHCARNYLALPSCPDSGSVLVQDLDSAQALCQLRAHNSRLQILAFSPDGSMLASASEKGTIVRVHHLPQACKVFTFRRGSYPATIQSLCFSPACIQPPLLSACSSKGTVHLFCLDSALGETRAVGDAREVLAAVLPISLPAIADVVDANRCLASIKVPCQGTAVFAAIVRARGEQDGAASHERAPQDVRVLAATANGFFYEYSVVNLDSSNGPICTLERECLLFESPAAEDAHSNARWLASSAQSDSENPMARSVMDLIEDPLSTSILDIDHTFIL